MALRRKWQQSGDLIASQAVRSDDGSEYAAVSWWKDKAAHDRHEDSPDEQEILTQVAGHFAGPQQEFGGEIIAQLDEPSG